MKILRKKGLMDLYNKLEIKESYYHSGFLYGLITALLLSNILRFNWVGDIIFMISYILSDQIIYRIWIKKNKKRLETQNE